MKNYSNYPVRNYSRASVRKKVIANRITVIFTLTLFAAVVIALISLLSSAVSAFGKESSRYYELESPFRHLQSSASEKSDEAQYSSFENCDNEYEEFIK